MRINFNLDFIEIKSTHDVEIQCSLQPTSVDSSVQTEIIQVENNDWNDEFSPFEEHTLSSIPQENLIKQTADHETQTDDSQQDKLAQINNKLKRALQTIKEKVQGIINEKPELFPDSNDDTIERIEHLISALRNQTAQIESLQAERDNAQKEINELRTEQHTSEVQSSQDHQKQINQLQQDLSQKDEERSLLREHLDSVELELTQTLDDYASAMNRLEIIVQERDALVEQHNLQLTE
jgi:chromosome segregation ATPase